MMVSTRFLKPLTATSMGVLIRRLRLARLDKRPHCQIYSASLVETGNSNDREYVELLLPPFCVTHSRREIFPPCPYSLQLSLTFRYSRREKRLTDSRSSQPSARHSEPVAPQGKKLTSGYHRRTERAQ